MNAKKLVATIALAGTLTVGAAGVASAADGSAGSAGNPAATALGARHPLLRRAVVGIVSKTLGVTRLQLRNALRSGKSISEYATSLGKDPQTVVDALVKAADARIDKAVSNGRITSQRADTLKAKVPGWVNQVVDHHFGQHAPATPSTTGQA